MSIWSAAVRRRLRPTCRPTFRPTFEALESRLVPYATSGNAWVHPNLITHQFRAGRHRSGPGAERRDHHQQPAKRVRQEVRQRGQLGEHHPQGRPDLGGVDEHQLSPWSPTTASRRLGAYQQGNPNFGDIRIGGYNFGNSSAGQHLLPAAGQQLLRGRRYRLQHRPQLQHRLDLRPVHRGHARDRPRPGHGPLHARATPSCTARTNGARHRPVKRRHQRHSVHLRGPPGRWQQHFLWHGQQRDLGAQFVQFHRRRQQPESQLDERCRILQLHRPGRQRRNDDRHSAVNRPEPVHAVDDGVRFGPADRARLQRPSSSRAGPSIDGATLSVSVSGVQAGMTYYVAVQGADSSVFSTGAYALTLNLGTGANPTVRDRTRRRPTAIR